MHILRFITPLLLSLSLGACSNDPGTVDPISSQDLGTIDSDSDSGTTPQDMHAPDQTQDLDTLPPLDMDGNDSDQGDHGTDQGDDTTHDATADLSQDMTSPHEVDRSNIIAMDREVPVYLPEDFDNSEPIPLVVALHGYSTSGGYINNYFKLEELTQQTHVAVLIPEGRRNVSQAKYWSATDACCSGQSLSTLEDDDLLFLRDLITQAKTRYDISKVFLVGHSNGGYMSYRMACDAADLIDGIMSLAGATFNDKERCAPSRPVKILQVHGIIDPLVSYEGNALYNIPSANDTVAYWAEYNACQTEPSQQDNALDLIGASSPETHITSYSGCDNNASVTLWSIEGGNHTPPLHDNFMLQVLEHLDD